MVWDSENGTQKERLCKTVRTQDLGVAGEERIALSSRPLTVWPSTSAGQEGRKHRDGGCLETFITV